MYVGAKVVGKCTQGQLPTKLRKRLRKFLRRNWLAYDRDVILSAIVNDYGNCMRVFMRSVVDGVVTVISVFIKKEPHGWKLCKPEAYDLPAPQAAVA